MVSNAAPIPRCRILVVDDDPVAADALAQLLSRDGHDTQTARDGEDALTRIDESFRTPDDDPPYDLLVTDLNMPRCDGLALLRRLRRRHRGVVPIVVTGYGRISSAVEAVKLGAIDFLTKPIVEEELRLAVRKAANQHALLTENGQLRQRLDHHEGLSTLIGADPRMQQAFGVIESVAASHTPVLITGEAGVGKSAVANAIHRRAAALAFADGDEPGPLVHFEFGNQDETQSTAALLGHARGAFPGARTETRGKIGEAGGGALVLHRLGLATPTQQAALHRIIESGTYQPVGSADTRRSNARLLFTARENPMDLIGPGGFREDLAHRLQPALIALPALRDRRADLLGLAEHFLQQHTAEQRKQRRLGEDAIAAIERHDWPGNVRELERAIEHAVLVSRSPVIGAADLPDRITESHDASDLTGGGAPAGMMAVPALADGWTPTPLETALRPCERQILLAALDANDWNRSETARQLDINRTTLYKKIRAYKLDEPADA